MEISELGSWAVGLALIVAFVEATKRVLRNLDRRWLPLVAVGGGVAWSIIIRYGGEPALTVLFGVAVGLAAIGLFSGSKATLGK